MKLFIISLLLISISAWSQDLRTTLGGKDLLIPKLGSKETLPEHLRFSPFIKNTFNKPGPFHGPNCYNTALIASGYSSPNAVRYVSPEEFEEILKVSFKEVASPNFKDIIVFDSRASRGHSAFYLGDNLIFHKKSYATHYHYRLTTIENAGVVEENEWTPGPVDDSSLQMNWPQLGNLPKSYYRLSSTQKPKLDSQLAPLIQMMEAALLKDLGQWAIARKWGMAGEYFLEDLLVYAKKIKASPYTIAVLTSMKDQVYIMLEEVNFKNARNPSKVKSELCIPEQSEQILNFINELASATKLSTDKTNEIISSFKNQDTTRCNFRPVLKMTSI